LDGTSPDRWRCDHWISGDLLAGSEDLFDDSNDDMHGHRSDERHELYVHGDRNERQWDVCSVLGVGGCDPVDGSRCADRSEGHIEFECHLNDFLDGPGFEWWRVNLRLLGDRLTGWCHVRHQWHDNLCHFRLDQWHELYVHGHCDQRQWYVSDVWCFGRSGSLHSSECTDRRFGDVECERSGCRVLDSSEQRWCRNHWIFGDFVAGGTDLCRHDCHDMHDHWSYQRHQLQLHGHGDEREWYVCGISGFGRGGSVHSAGSTDSGAGEFEPGHQVNDLLDGTSGERRCSDLGVFGDVVAGFQDLHDDRRHDMQHWWSHQWRELHVHCHGDERQWLFGGVCCVSGGGSVNGPRRTDGSAGDFEPQHHIGDLMDSAGVQWWRLDHWLHRDVLAGCENLHDNDCDNLHHHRFDQWHQLHVHRHGDEREWYLGGVGAIGCCDSVDDPRRAHGCVRDK